METLRKPLQGTLNIIRFNWHLYLFAIAGLMVLIAAANFTGGMLRVVFVVFLVAAFVSLCVSLAVSLYVYDLSGFYELKWLDDISLKDASRAVNINAGFDETSESLQAKFTFAEFSVLDFYDPQKHTEISIERARKAYPRFPGTRQIETSNIPMKDGSADVIFLIFAAHEIRDADERQSFFCELERILSPKGKVVVTEHLRYAANLLAYNIGSFHFHPRSAWLKTFATSKLKINREMKFTPFVTTFVLEKNGISS